MKNNIFIQDGATIRTLNPSSVAQAFIFSEEQRAKIKQLNDDDEINSEINRLNNIKEPERDRSWKSSFPANSNSVLHTPLSQKTKELLERIKQNEK